MIDLHCHILPGIDDGAETMEASIAMAEKPLVRNHSHPVYATSQQRGISQSKI